MVLAVAPCEAGIVTLFVVLRRTRFDKSKPFQPRDVFQELIFVESGALESWLKRCESLALNAAAVCEHRLLPILCILEKTWETGCDARFSGQRRDLSA